MTFLPAFCEPKKKSRLAIALQRGYNDCEGPNSFIKEALRIAPASSNPATLARDLQLFHEGGYSLCSADGLVPADTAGMEIVRGGE